jgi:hypothetical protein
LTHDDRQFYLGAIDEKEGGELFVHGDVFYVREAVGTFLLREVDTVQEDADGGEAAASEGAFE